MKIGDLEIAQVMFKLARKDNWGHKYDRLEHFKRFQNLDDIVKELKRRNWLIKYDKPNFTGIALNTQFKKEIVDFIKQQLPHLSEMIK
ncbi:MAG: hypothetical protein AABW80_04910 [Nanoarchaeota archaeon]